MPDDFTSDEITRIEAPSLDEIKEQIKIAEYEEFVMHRKIWSYSLLGVLCLLVTSNLALLVLVGLKILLLDAEFLKVVYIAFVFEIIGLITIVIKFLFNKPPTL